jgi:hypothetical protein
MGGGSDLLSILLQLERQDSKPTSPLKFNPTWLDDEEQCKDSKRGRVGFDENSRNTTSFQILVALKKVKVDL